MYERYELTEFEGLFCQRGEGYLTISKIRDNFTHGDDVEIQAFSTITSLAVLVYFSRMKTGNGFNLETDKHNTLEATFFILP